MVSAFLMNPLAPIQKNPVFKYFASVKLAVPLMTVLLVSSAAGTVLESKYNAEIATIYVYRALWFIALLVLLWVNIFCATVARWPFRKHHLGFVITHAGLLTLLVGGIMTATLGTDGQLQVIEGQADNEVFLPGLVVKQVSAPGRVIRIPFERRVKEASGRQLAFINSQLEPALRAEKFLPFVSAERGYEEREGGAGTAIRFTLKSPFFELTDWLHSEEKPELRMGPATIRVVADRKAKTSLATPSTPQARDALIVKRVSGEVAARIPVAELRKGPVQVGSVRVHLVRAFRRAAVAENKLVEGASAENPALELRLEHQGKSVREITFARFENFSLNPKGVFGLSFSYAASGGEGAGLGTAGGSDRSGNVVEFHLGEAKSVRVELYKDAQPALRRDAKAGKPLQTPWMGMTVRLDEVLVGAAEARQVRRIELPERSQLPPSAIYFRPSASSSAGETGFWLVEGEARDFPGSSGRAQVYFGQDSIRLPFAIRLNKFSKIDYPGTEMAMSYESEVQVNNAPETHRIAMNEPLKRDGYTLYQSSYILKPGERPVSVFSVNRDPGRQVKYFGSVLLCIGIAVFTLMRSRWYLGRERAKRSSA